MTTGLNVEALTVKQLKAALKRLSVSRTGTKKELQERLAGALAVHENVNQMTKEELLAMTNKELSSMLKKASLQPLPKRKDQMIARLLFFSDKKISAEIPPPKVFPPGATKQELEEFEELYRKFEDAAYIADSFDGKAGLPDIDSLEFYIRHTHNDSKRVAALQAEVDRLRPEYDRWYEKANEAIAKAEELADEISFTAYNRLPGELKRKYKRNRLHGKGMDVEDAMKFFRGDLPEQQPRRAD